MNLRYNTTGIWLKGNTHIHSTALDGAILRPAVFINAHPVYAQVLCGLDNGCFTSIERVLQKWGEMTISILNIEKGGLTECINLRRFRVCGGEFH